MRKIFKLWIKTRNNVALAMMVASGVWMLSAMNCAEDDPDYGQMLASGFFGLWWLSKGIKWNSVYKG